MEKLLREGCSKVIVGVFIVLVWCYAARTALSEDTSDDTSEVHGWVTCSGCGVCHCVVRCVTLCLCVTSFVFRVGELSVHQVCGRVAQLLRYTHIHTPLDDSTRPLDNSTNSTLHNPQRAGALASWMEGHTGGSRSIPTVHPCSQSGRRLWVARKALHLHESNHEGNGRSIHNMVAEPDTFHSQSAPGQHSVS